MNSQYPIGKHVPQDYSKKLKNEGLSDIKLLPNQIEAVTISVNVSIPHLHSLHSRWHAFLVDFNESDFQKSVFYTEYTKRMSLWFLLGLYAWHGKYHVAHITQWKERIKWCSAYWPIRFVSWCELKPRKYELS